MPNNLLHIKTPAQDQAADLKAEYGLSNHGLSNLNCVYWNLPVKALYEEAIFRGEGRISANEEKVLLAAARSHKNTGCPIITHTTGGGMGLEQLDIFAAEQVPPEVVIISHIDDLAYAEQLLQRGANLSIDRIGTTAFFSDEHWLEMIAGLINKGYVNQIMLSHDAAVFVYGLDIVSGENVFDDYTYISRVFLPKLKGYGVSDEQIHIMLHENPKRKLNFYGLEA